MVAHGPPAHYRSPLHADWLWTREERMCLGGESVVGNPGLARLQVLGAEDGDVGGGVLGWGEFLFVKVVS